MKYKFLPHTADVMFEAYGKTVEELFENAALATEEIMVKLSTLKIEECYDIILESDNVDGLLYNFLSELLFVKDTEGLLFKKFDIIIQHKNKKYELLAKCKGERINRHKHKLLDDAKAITMHEFNIKQEKGKWTAKVLVDI